MMNRSSADQVLLLHPLKQIDFIFFDAGGGHRTAAFALKSVIEAQNRPWAVRLVNLQEILDPLDIFRKYAGVRMQDIYNLLLKKGLTLGSPQILKAMHGLIRLYHREQVNMLTEYWSQFRADLIVSLIPNFNRAIFHAIRNADRAQGRSPTPMVTILTDFADYPPHFWIERQEQYFICGTPKAARQARLSGHPESRVFEVSGMIVRPPFYQRIEASREEERVRLGLRPDLPTALILFGGQGSNRMLAMARRLGQSDLPLQMIALCGRNELLRQKLENLDCGIPLHVEGFTSEVPFFMHLSDFLIGKPGPGSISEALVMNLPVVVERNLWTLAQERYNTEWIEENQVGIVLDSFKDIVEGVNQLLRPGKLACLRASVAARQNRAVFEIPDVLEKLLLPETPSLPITPRS